MEKVKVWVAIFSWILQMLLREGILKIWESCNTEAFFISHTVMRFLLQLRSLSSHWVSKQWQHNAEKKQLSFSEWYIFFYQIFSNCSQGNGAKVWEISRKLDKLNSHFFQNSWVFNAIWCTKGSTEGNTEMIEIMKGIRDLANDSIKINEMVR